MVNASELEIYMNYKIQKTGEVLYLTPNIPPKTASQINTLSNAAENEPNMMI
jgi:hypothetical protein